MACNDSRDTLRSNASASRSTDSRGELSPELERELVDAAQGRRDGNDGGSHGRLARQREVVALVNNHLGLVRYLVSRVGPRSAVEREDLEAIGVEAILRCVDRFDTARGTRFSSFAGTAIWLAISDELSNAWREVPVGLDPYEVVPRPEVAPAADEVAAVRQEVSQVRAALSLLDDEDSAVLTARYGLDGSKPLAQVALAAAMGRTRRRIRTAEARALAAMRDLLSRDTRLE